uniref:Uncharacterized protein n=1 Tax=Timema douglasi TaxID=61478 RepID=A0A7R8VHU0_TIMDO|nr:unnamed protein product [Timema douglasi]
MPTSLSARDLRRRSQEHRDSFLVDDVSTTASEDRPSCWSWVALAAAFLVQPDSGRSHLTEASGKAACERAVFLCELQAAYANPYPHGMRVN